MLPGNIDPRRPEKQQRYKPPPASNNAAPGEDLTPDYMNILDSQRKSMQTPRNDRFKVVKIESTEPFKRGRWKCMDFLDQSYAKVFQQNYNNRSSEGRPPSPKNNDPTKINSNTASYVDLQSSMLQIFYRQNSLENHNNQCLCSNNGQNVSPFDCCDETRKYQNHVLMPGMVSSSLVALDFPIEFNFTPDNPGHLPLIFKEHTHHHSNNNQCIINHLECCCKTQTSNVDIQKFHQNMSSEQVTIQSTQISNYAQISPDLIQKNLNVPPQELINQNSGINYVQNLIPNDPSKSVRNYQNQQTSVIKDEQIIDNGNQKVQQILTQQNYLSSSQANGANNNNPIYVNIQNLTCPQKAVVNINESNSSTTKNLISDQQITSSTEAPNSVGSPQNNKNALENVCDSTTENMAQNNQNNNVMNGSYVPHNLVQNSNETMPTEYFQNLVQNLDPNNPNLVQKFVVPNTGMAQNCVSPNGNNVHYIVYSANSNAIQQTSNNNNNGNCVSKTNGNTANSPNQNFVPNNSNGSYVQNIVQNTVNASQNLITNNENVNLIQANGANNQIVTSKGNSNQNLPQINNQSNSNPNLMQQNTEKITQNVNLYQGQISVVEASSCTYKQQQEVTPIYQNSQNSIQNSLPSNTCIHAFLTEERALVQNTANTNEGPGAGGKLVSNLPVDTKIEALMDLVKKHLKCTVMEDVNVLKHKILELKERIAQLEYENELLKNQYKRNSMQ